MRPVRRKGFLLAGLVATALTALAGSAQGAVTIGSNLAGMPAANDPGCAVAGVTCTATNLSLPSTSLAAGGLTSPVNGTVTSWRANANTVGTNDNISLQVLRPVSGTTYTGIATSTPQSWPGPAISPAFSISLPIRIGDAIGLRNPNARLIYANTIGAQVAAWYVLPGGPLGDGQTRAADMTGNNTEALVQATVEPANSVTTGATANNKKKGTATVSISVPNPGQLSYSGTGVSVTGPASVAAPGDVQLTVRATGKKAKKLKKKGKTGVSFGVTFTPKFGAAGITPEDLTLRKKLKRK
jgi:hypothetical protein